MGMTGASCAFLLSVDGRVWGVCSFLTTDLVKRKLPELFETFAMSAQTDKHPRIIRALMLCICSEEMALAVRNRYSFNRVWKIERVVTRCFAKYRHLKHHRPPWEKTKSEKMENGLYKLTYAANIQKGWRFADAIRFWENENERLAKQPAPAGAH
jgi:hypothetical protein